VTIHEEWIRYGSKNEFTGYAARLANVKEPMPAVIVIQEIWGVDDHIQDVTRRLAGAGYTAFAPDLFSLDGSHPDPLRPERVELAKSFLNSLPPAAWRNPVERDEALNLLPPEERLLVAETLGVLLGGLNTDNFIGNIVAAAAFLRNEYAYSKGQGVASVGFCLGGALSGLLASQDPQLKSAVIYYGNAPSAERIATIACPVLGFYGELDKRLIDGLPSFVENMKEADKSLEYYVYPNAQHAFFNDTRPSYHNAASRISYTRLLSFLNETLQ
jgi:carboxymethylenebutenolidase